MICVTDRSRCRGYFGFENIIFKMMVLKRLKQRSSENVEYFLEFSKFVKNKIFLIEKWGLRIAKVQCFVNAVNLVTNRIMG